MTLSRRGILGAIICAPAIVRASSLMPVKSMLTAQGWNEWHVPGYYEGDYWQMTYTEWVRRNAIYASHIPNGHLYSVHSVNLQRGMFTE